MEKRTMMLYLTKIAQQAQSIHNLKQDFPLEELELAGEMAQFAYKIETLVELALEELAT